jgi:hypothetical protein
MHLETAQITQFQVLLERRFGRRFCSEESERLGSNLIEVLTLLSKAVKR